MSHKVYFIADPHFGHENMARYRGFQDAFYQDEHIVDLWNRTVNKNDTVWLLGDVTMEKKNYEILGRLKGRINVVLGNHDMKQHVPELLKYVNSVSGMVGYKHCILTHCPIHPMELDYRYTYNIHGHIHDKYVMLDKKDRDYRYLCVSCEKVGYKPKTLEELLNQINK